MFEWLITETLSTTAITYRLRAFNAPTKTGKIWSRRTVQGILTNPSYTGVTYAFTSDKHGHRFQRPQAEWIKLDNVTPAIISQEIFDAAQRQLKINKTKTVTHTTHQYLLRGRVRCQQCGQAYVGVYSKGRYYRCTGKLKIYSPLGKCSNKTWNADRLESMVWGELVKYLGDRALIQGKLQQQRHDAGQVEVYEAELIRVERQWKTLDQEQHQLLQWALKGFPEKQVESECKRLNKAKETLEAQKVEIEANLKISREAVVNVRNLERFIETVQKRLPVLDFEGKRLALEYLNITIWIDGNKAKATGVIKPDSDSVTLSASSESRTQRDTLPFSFKLTY